MVKTFCVGCKTNKRTLGMWKIGGEARIATAFTATNKPITYNRNWKSLFWRPSAAE